MCSRPTPRSKRDQKWKEEKGRQVKAAKQAREIDHDKICTRAITHIQNVSDGKKVKQEIQNNAHCKILKNQHEAEKKKDKTHSAGCGVIRNYCEGLKKRQEEGFEAASRNPNFNKEAYEENFHDAACDCLNEK